MFVYIFIDYNSTYRSRQYGHQSHQGFPSY